MTFAGIWDCTISTQVGNQKVKLHIREDAGVVTGEAVGVETVQFIDPKAAGDRLSWSQKITKPMPMTIRFDITVNDNELAGIAKPGVFPACKVTGQRVTA